MKIRIKVQIKSVYNRIEQKLDDEIVNSVETVSIWLQENNFYNSNSRMHYQEWELSYDEKCQWHRYRENDDIYLW